MQLFHVPSQVFITQILEDLLSIEDVQRVSQASWKTLEAVQCYAAVMNFAWPRLELGLGKGKTSLRQWMPVYEAVAGAVAAPNTGSSNSSNSYLRRLNRLISFKHTRYCSNRDDYLKPVPWHFRDGAVEPFLRFMWKECTAEKGSSHPDICAATFVDVLGGQPMSLREREPLAIIAMDATYCENGRQDEFFNMAVLLLLDDLRIALILTLAFEITENEGFFSILLVGAGLEELLIYASAIFGSPAWTWTLDPANPAGRGGEELAEWFGFDMRKVASFEDRQELLPGIGMVMHFQWLYQSLVF